MNPPPPKPADDALAHPRAAATLAVRDSLDPAAPYADQTALQTLLRRTLADYGLVGDAPLGQIIPPGARVLLKPNWVLHKNQGSGPLAAVVTAPELLVALLGELARTDATHITLADAPVQGCDFDRLVTDDFRHAARAALRPDQKLEILDLRRTLLESPDVPGGVEADARSHERYALFDLRDKSLLESVTGPNAFRVTMYDPDALRRTHAPGRHQYLVAKELFEHDVIISIPKLKTHRKAGLTAGLKNLVGINGNKEYLPHHRVGGSAHGGDCYPGRAPLKSLAERAIDGANARMGTLPGRYLRKTSGALVWLHERLGILGHLLPSTANLDLANLGLDGEADLEGGWYGNDTVWRMCLDLNRILLYGDTDATMTEAPRRRVFTLTDAILCGHGEGPLAPDPLYVGALTFADNAAVADQLHSALLRLDPQRIPLIRESHAPMPWPLVASNATPTYLLDGEALPLSTIAQRAGHNATPPRGWVGHCENLAVRR